MKKLLARLDDKGYVRRDRSQMTHRFAAAVSRDELIGRRLQGLADSLCDGSGMPLLMHLLKTENFTAIQRRQLHEMVEEHRGV